MMRKATWWEVVLGMALVAMAVTFTCIPKPALASSPMAMLRALSSGITLHTWTTGDVLRAGDLNANFTALNNGKVGGGILLVNADVNNSAGIAHSKLATPALLPKAWARVTANCDGTAGGATPTACTVGDSSQLSITANNSSGQYRGILSYTPANANFAVIVTSHTAANVCIADTTATSSPHFIVKCFDYTGAAANNNQFSVLVMDT